MLKNKTNRAFTLVEIMVSALLLIIISGAVLSVLISSSNVWDNNMGMVDLQQKTRQAIHSMSRELRQARTNSISIDSAVPEISFSIPDPSDLEGDGHAIRYFYDSDGSRIVRANPSGTDCITEWTANCLVVVSHIDEVEFSCLLNNGACDYDGGEITAMDTIKIDLIAAKSVKGRVLEVSLSKKVKLRND